MNVKLLGSPETVKPLASAVAASLEELGLSSAVSVSASDDAEYARSLGVTKFPALAIEEESIGFRDMIFEGTVPPNRELTAMFISILGQPDAGGHGCGTGGCGSCGSSGSCASAQ